MVDCVDGDAPPPQELTTAWQCERWRTLPEVGAYYDQDYQLMKHITIASNVYAAWARAQNLGQNIHQLTNQERRILRVLYELGLIFTAR